MGCKDRLGTQAGLEPLLFGEHQSGVPRKGAACGGRAASAYAVCMKKPPKVVPIEEPKYRLIAEDQNTHRIIFGIGSERMAIDLFSRITKLPPATGDRPAEVLAMKKVKRKRRPEGPAAEYEFRQR